MTTKTTSIISEIMDMIDKQGFILAKDFARLLNYRPSDFTRHTIPKLENELKTQKKGVNKHLKKHKQDYKLSHLACFISANLLKNAKSVNKGNIESAIKYFEPKIKIDIDTTHKEKIRKLSKEIKEINQLSKEAVNILSKQRKELKPITEYDFGSEREPDIREAMYAKQLQKELGYLDRKHFINKVTELKSEMPDHIREVSTMVNIGSGAKREVVDYVLDKEACVRLGLKGDETKKPKVKQIRDITTSTLAQNSYNRLQKSDWGHEIAKANERINNLEDKQMITDSKVANLNFKISTIEDKIDTLDLEGFNEYNKEIALKNKEKALRDEANELVLSIGKNLVNYAAKWQNARKIYAEKTLKTFPKMKDTDIEQIEDFVQVLREYKTNL